MTELQILELAKQLGRELRDSKKYAEYMEAKAAFLANEELGTKLCVESVDEREIVSV